MSSLKTIIKLELIEAFYSPITWLILIIFSIQNFYNYTDIISQIVSSQEIFGNSNHITSTIFCGNNGIYVSIQKSLFWYVPLLSMNIFAKEINSGTYKLLFSSPIKVREIVLGKFTVLMIIGIIMLCTLLIIIIPSIYLIENIDYGLIFSGILGLLLLYMIYSAIGMFMSSLTGHSILAGIATFSTLLFLNIIDSIGQYSSIARDITYWLSLQGRANNFIKGVISINDCSYFILLTILITVFTVICINNRQQKEPKRKQLCKYILCTLPFFFLAYISNRYFPYTSIDMTQNKANTLSPVSLDIMKRMKQPITITTFVNMADNFNWIGVPSGINADKKNFLKYLRANPDIHFKYVYYEAEPYRNADYDDPNRVPTPEISRLFCQVNHVNYDKLLRGSQLYKMYPQIDLRKEENTFVRLLEYPDHPSQILRVFNDMNLQPSEAEISIAMKNLSSNTQPIIGYVLNGKGRGIQPNDEQSFHLLFNGKFLRQSAINQGFHVKALNIDTVTNNFKPYSLLVIPDISQPLDSGEQKKMLELIDSGKNMLIVCDPKNTEAQSFILNKLKLHFLEGELLYLQKSIDKSVIPAKTTIFFQKMSPFMMEGQTMMMPTAAALDYDMDSNFEIYPIIQTLKDRCVLFNNQLFDKDARNIQKPRQMISKQYLYNTALAMTRTVKGKDQRIIVTSDADFISDKILNTQYEGFSSDNNRFLLGTLYWLSHGKAPLFINNQRSNDTSINLKFSDLKFFKALILYPFAIILIFTAFILIIRRNRF